MVQCSWLVQMMDKKNYRLLHMQLLTLVLSLLKILFLFSIKILIYFIGLINLIVTTAHAFSNSFWRQMEPFFGFLSDADIANLKQQVMVTVLLFKLLRFVIILSPIFASE